MTVQYMGYINVAESEILRLIWMRLLVFVYQEQCTV